ncbi:Uncharacterised protein [Cedecea neteri]|uniref:Uncharacterized protein n=1 Tax=Cedecea neteri TaxID=158822 RepID=A0A2X3INE6_9ENTR|nr:Uncharacterised protein [Cedecea neteri]
MEDTTVSLGKNNTHMLSQTYFYSDSLISFLTQ